MLGIAKDIKTDSFVVINELSTEINEWLSENEHAEILEIKIVSDDNMSEVLIIYREDKF